MAYNNREEYNVNEEQIAAFLAEAVKHVEGASESEIKALAQIKKLFKKNVPFSRRSYVAAYLIKNAVHGFKGNRFNRNERSDRFSSNRSERYNRNERNEKHASSGAEEHTERPQRVTIAPEEAGTIFIGVGRSRGVFPRDLVGLISGVAGLDRSRIGEIRVLSNYSFIQLFQEDCDKVIAALNGHEYRGRSLSVSYSRKRDENAESSEGQATAEVASTPAEDMIPASVSNEGHADFSANTEESKIAAEQSAFASSMESAPVAEEPKAEEKTYFETTDDGQVKSHFVSNN